MGKLVATTATSAAVSAGVGAGLVRLPGRAGRYEYSVLAFTGACLRPPPKQGQQLTSHDAHSVQESPPATPLG